MITSRETLNMAFALRYSRGCSDDDIPEEVKTILTSGEKLAPKHCSTEVIEELFIERVKMFEPRFTVDENCAPVLRLMAQRIARSDEFTAQYGLNKGIMLLGGIGSGKTVLMRGMVDILMVFDIKVHLLPTYVLTENYGRDGVNAFGRINHANNDVYPGAGIIVLDDLGAEGIASHYGQPINVVAEVLLRRYDNHALTFGTSNLDQKSIRRFYGERVWSRMKEMFNFIELKGEDRRK